MKLRTAWYRLTAEPYRVMLAGGTLQLLATLAFWSRELLGRHSGLGAPLETVVAGSGAHAFLMLFGLFPFFILGFLMTTYPRWLDAPAVPRSRYLPSALLLMAGAAGFHLGLYVALSLAVAGVAVFLVGYVIGVQALRHTARRARMRGRAYERYLMLALVIGGVGIGLFLARLLGWQLPWTGLYPLGLWGFLAPILVVVSHRMLPFLTSCVPDTDPVSQPRGGLHLMVILLWLHGLLELLEYPAWLWPIDLALAVVAAYHLRCWAFARCLRSRLLAMFHVSFAWFVGAMLLYALWSLQLYLGHADGLARIPLHAFGIGFALGMTVAMTTRIALAHAGRQPVAGPGTWLAFLGIGTAALLRMAGEFGGLAYLNPVAGLLLLAVLLYWAYRHLPLLVAEAGIQ
ncbi:MAG TPA: NnrS family protein [Thiohalobacter sp.]|nr:NnrS family protein [Thiohalobacter sp.]